MSRPRAAAVAVLAGLACSCGGEEPLPPAACDVLVVSLDTTRADVLTFDDADTAPNLTRLAERGVVFTNAIAGSSWTLPSHVELFTGLPSALHGVHDDELAIDPRHRTLPEHLAARGARAIGVWTGWYLAGAYGFARGFERYVSAMAPSTTGDQQLASDIARGGETAFWAGDVRAAESHRDVSSERAIDAALLELARVAPDERLFLFVHLFDPHYDFLPPEPFDERFDPDYEGSIDGRDYWRNPAIWDPRRDPRRAIGDRDLEHVRALYRGEVAWCDHQLGRLFDALDEAGRLARTLVVVTADHGEEFFEHGNRGHRQTLYEEALRVPLLVVPPAAGDGPDPARRGARSDALAALSDILPTVVDYAGGPAPEHVWGRSLRPWIEGGAGAERPALASLGMVATSRAGGRSLRLLEAFHFGDEKLVRRVRLDPDGRPEEVESVEWFDLARDPGEERDPTPEDLPRMRAAWERVEALQAELRRFADALPRSSARARRTDVRDVFADELGALGYADDLPPVDRARGARWPDGPLGPLEW